MKLNAVLREQTGSSAARKDRAAGLIPGALYGHGIEDTLAINVSRREFEALLRELGPNAVFDLEVEGKTHKVFIRDFTPAALKDIILDIDLLAVSADQKIEVEIPLFLHNAEALQVGIVETVLQEILISTTPDNIPQSFDIDVAGMEIGDTLTAADLELPEDAELMIDPEETIVTVSAPMDELEEVDPDAEMAEPEVIGAADEDEE